MRLKEVAPEMVGHVPLELYRVTATYNNRIIKEFLVLGNIHWDPSGTAAKYAKMVGMDRFLEGQALAALNRIQSLNHSETELGEPLYPAGATLLVEPVEFEVAGIEVPTRHC